jgi:TPP-dependent pyruvate/acetoin dehydrogenase alpha subunit
MTKNLEQVSTADASPQVKGEGFSLISNAKLIEIYSAMLKCRMIEERAGLLCKQGRLPANLNASMGQEASAAALVIDLLPGDTLCPAANDIMPAFVKGLSLEEMFRAIVEGSLGSGDRKILPPSPSITVQLKSVSQEARALKTANQGAVVVAFFTNEIELVGAWRETVSVAGKERLPIIFICQPDAGHHTAEEAMIFGVPAIVVDGIDAVALYRVATEAMNRARQGRGPTLVECITLLSDDPEVNASNENCIYTNTEQSLALDPIATMEKYLSIKGLFDKQLCRQITSEFASELDLATRFLNP